MGTRIFCTRRLQFCCGHRVYQHEGKCKYLHGHNYVVEVTTSGLLDSVGRVIDFSVIKELVGNWIERNWDHGMILFEKDKDMLRMNFDMMKVFWLPSNPTAENLAAYLLLVANELLEDTGVIVNRVRLFETENCYADAVLD